MLSKTRDETIAIGSKLAKTLTKGDVVALMGELGSGKTVLTKGIAAGLGVKDVRYVNSPTFVIIKEYRGKLPLYHFDLYRLDHAGLLDSLNCDEYFYGNGVCVIEWAERILHLLPKKRVEVRLSVVSDTERRIAIKNVGGRVASRKSR